jgi:hypothetical protein
MSGGCFERYVVNKYGSYDVPGSGYAHTHTYTHHTKIHAENLKD